MIYVGGVPLSTDSESPPQGSDMLFALMEHPILTSASSSFNDIPERNLTISEESGSERSRRSKCVYVSQREYATIDPALVDVCSFIVSSGKSSLMLCHGSIFNDCFSFL
ncbi:hypothetical protein RHGRI_019512 [Rhododendron griersonianum]|uniref:Uncharacterized protein n=1 Tax=Rhododendron griersonianum TaxID=479676 RepID=A0AAV6JHM2_9ERIC|nr:hypothetical protein RHGRI_019512 [Rhododendron griersonianum]